MAVEEFPKVGMLIKQLNSELEKDANNALRRDNLTLSQISVLIELNEAENQELDMKQMEKKLHVAQSTLAGIVSRLEEKGFVEGRQSDTDRRVKVVHLTKEGEDCCKVARQRADQAEAKLLSPLTDTEQQILLTLLIKVRKAF